MRSILDELFYGNVYPSEDRWSCTKDARELIGYIADHHDNLRESLTDEQRELFDKLNDCQTEIEAIAERALFAYAFKLGMRIAIEVFSGDKYNEKSIENF